MINVEADNREFYGEDYREDAAEQARVMQEKYHREEEIKSFKTPSIIKNRIKTSFEKQFFN